MGVKVSHLGNVGNALPEVRTNGTWFGTGSGQPTDKFDNRLFAHAVDKGIGTAVYQNAGQHLVLPVVVVREPAHTGFDASEYDGDIGIETLQYLGIDDRRIFGPHVRTGIGSIGIVAAQTLVGRIFVDHGVHAAGTDTEKQAGTSQLLEIAQVVAPVGLGYNGYPQAFGFEDTANDSRTERGVVYVSIAAEKDDIQFVPSTEFHFFFGSGQPVCKPVFFHGRGEGMNCKVSCSPL